MVLSWSGVAIRSVNIKHFHGVLVLLVSYLTQSTMISDKTILLDARHHRFEQDSFRLLPVICAEVHHEKMGFCAASNLPPPPHQEGRQT